MHRMFNLHRNIRDEQKLHFLRSPLIAAYLPLRLIVEAQAHENGHFYSVHTKMLQIWLLDREKFMVF